MPAVSVSNTIRCGNGKDAVAPATFRFQNHISSTWLTTSGRLKDWRRVRARCNRCAYTFMSAICIAAIIIFWL